MPEEKKEYYDVFQTAIKGKYLRIGFAKRKPDVSKDEELTDDKVEDLVYADIPPQFLAPILDALFTLGLKYQEQTGNYIGVGEEPSETNAQEE